MTKDAEDRIIRAILKRLDKIDDKIDMVIEKVAEHEVRLNDHDKKFDQIIAKLLEHDRRMDTFVTKNEFKKAMNRIYNNQDRMLKRMERYEHEQACTVAWVGRIDSDVEELKILTKT